MFFMGAKVDWLRFLYTPRPLVPFCLFNILYKFCSSHWERVRERMFSVSRIYNWQWTKRISWVTGNFLYCVFLSAFFFPSALWCLNLCLFWLGIKRMSNLWNGYPIFFTILWHAAATKLFQHLFVFFKIIFLFFQNYQKCPKKIDFFLKIVLIKSAACQKKCFKHLIFLKLLNLKIDLNWWWLFVWLEMYWKPILYLRFWA